jgi:hypothetical protein
VCVVGRVNPRDDVMSSAEVDRISAADADVDDEAVILQLRRYSQLVGDRVGASLMPN